VSDLNEAATPVTPRREAQEVNVLLRRWHSGRDRRARDELVRRFLPLARKLALRYVRSSEPLEDLVQVATLGLLAAIDRFDPARGTAFSSFAVPTILGELKRHFRDHCWYVHVPRGEQELALKVQRAEQELVTRLGRSPTIDQLAELLELSAEEVCDALEVSASYRPVSLDAPVGDGDGQPTTLSEAVGDVDDRYGLIDTTLSLSSAFAKLTAREQLLLEMRFGDGMTQREIGMQIGLSQMQVSRLLRQVLVRLRALSSPTIASVPPPAAASR
jgi:RNA polymerase sigma-B factor